MATMRDYRAARSIEAAKSAMDIGKIPPVKNRRRRKKSEKSLQVFCETYLSDKFCWAWSQDQRDAIALLQRVVLEGGQFALAMYRGGGKTSMCEAAVLWAVLYGHRKFVVVVGATDGAATDILSTIKYILESNELLAADFPEAIHPITQLEGEARRCNRQTYKSVRTRIEWGQDRITLATIPKAACSGAIVQVVGITGRMLGMKRGNLRPDCLLIDDPQSRDSAASPTQNAKRIQIVQRQALKLAGPKKRIACMMPCTIIFPGDMVDELTDRQKHPEFNGERRRLVHQFPTNKAWWENYREVRAEGMRQGDNGKAARDLYLAERETADAGAVIAWPEYTKGKASAVQYVMDEFIDDPDGAAAELNNEPKSASLLTDLAQLTELGLSKKLNTLSRGLVPRECNRLTAFIDVQQECLFWMVCGFTEKFGGAVVECGVFPEQPAKMFEVSSVPRPLSGLYPKLEPRARIYAALTEVVNALSSRSFRQQDADSPMSISIGLIDSGFETSTVHEFLGRTQFKAIWKASKGRTIGPAGKPMNEYRREAGDQVGWNWRIDARTTARGRFVSFDTLPWKSAVADALLAPPGSASAFYLPGSELRDNPLLISHLLSEYRTETMAVLSGRRVQEWRLRPDCKENHWWDCLIGCAVAASVSGLQWSAASAAGESVADGPKKPKLSMAARQAAKRGAANG